MDNDNKIDSTQIVPKNNRHSEVMLFLNDELQGIQDEEGLQFYNLEEEYSKTKKNRKMFSAIVICITVAVVVITCFGVNKVISAQNEKIQVNLAEFDDLNLKGLLDNVSKTQSKYDEALSTKLQAETAMETELKDAKMEMENNIFILDSLKLRSQKEYNNRKNEILKTYTNRQQEINSKYSEKIILAQKEVDLYKAELEKFDTVKVEAAKEQEKALNSERQLRELETKKITQKYEAQIKDLEKQIENMRSKNSDNMKEYINELIKKYEGEIASLDPLLQDSVAQKIVSNTKTGSSEEIMHTSDSLHTSENLQSEENLQSQKNYAETPEYNPNFNIDRFIEEKEIKDQKVVDALNEYQNFYKDYNYLDNAILDLPHKNSIPEYITASRILVNQMGQALAENAATMLQEKEEAQKNVDSLQSEVNKQKNLLEKEKKSHKADIESYEKQIKDQKEAYDDILSNSLTLAKTNAVILSVESADTLTIKVYVAQKVRESISEEGIAAEIKAGKNPVKGLLKKQDDDFIFEPGLDKNGNAFILDESLILIGSAVKTSLK